MDINKAFYVETANDGNSRIYNVGKKFFSGKEKSPGLLKRFEPSGTGEKNAYISRLKKEGWLPLSMEDIKQININKSGVITAYPFKYRKGYIRIEKLETIAHETGFAWRRADHGTNPFSAVLDYTDLIEKLAKNKDCNIKPLKALVDNFSNRLSSIGAIDTLESFFTAAEYVPDPRRFNKTAKELWAYYRSHLADCCRLVCMKHFNAGAKDLDMGLLITRLRTIEALQRYLTEEAYSRRFK